MLNCQYFLYHSWQHCLLCHSNFSP